MFQVGDGSSTAGTTAPSPSTSTTVKPEPWHDPFLPRNTKPLHYDLYMDPDFYYDGTHDDVMNTFRIIGPLCGKLTGHQ